MDLIPVYIRECAAFSIFKTTLKVWLKENQICDRLFILMEYDVILYCF